MSQLRLTASDKLKAWQANKRYNLFVYVYLIIQSYPCFSEEIERDYAIQSQQSSKQPSEIFINHDEHQMAKLCKFANAIEAPKFLYVILFLVSFLSFSYIFTKG